MIRRQLKALLAKGSPCLALPVSHTGSDRWPVLQPVCLNWCYCDAHRMRSHTRVAAPFSRSVACNRVATMSREPFHQNVVCYR